MPWKECFGGGRLESLLEANLGPISKCGRASTCACHDGQLVKNPVGVEKGGVEGEAASSPRRSSPTHAMASRVRHCVECPKCLTRYLPGFSPYRNGSYLMPLAEGFADEWTLYCACGRPPISSRWSWSDLKLYAVSNQAHDRGYGPPADIVPVDQKSRFSG